MRNLVRGRRIFLLSLIASITLLFNNHLNYNKQNVVLAEIITEQNLHMQQQLETKNIIALIGRTESGLRGYIISKDKKFVAQFNSNIDSVKNSFSKLNSANKKASTSIEQSKLKLFEDILFKKIEFMSSAKSLCDQNKFDQAAELIITGKGPQLTDSLLKINGTLNQLISSHLESEQNQFSENNNYKSFLSDFGFYSSIGILILSFLFLGREINKAIKIKNDLSEHDQKFGITLNSVDDGVISTNTNGNITYMNPAAEKLTGWKLQEADNEPLEKIYDVINEQTGQSFENIVTRILKNGKTIEFENSTVLKSKNSIDYIISNSGSPIVDANGKMIGTVLVFRDLTRQKKAEKLLNESEMKYRSLFENMQDGIYKSSPQGKFIEVNPAMVSMLGYSSKDELMNIDIKSELYFQESEREMAIRQGSTTESGVFRLRKKDGTELWVEDSGRYVSDNDGKVLYHEGSLRDVTARKKAEEKLFQLSQALEQSPVSVVITNKNGDIEYVNKKFSDVTCYTKQEIIGKNPRILKSGYTSPDEYKNLWNNIISGNDWRGEFHNKKKNGELYWESALISPILNMNGEIVNFLAVKEDISEKKIAEQNLLNQNAELQKINLELDKFVYSTSHDLRVPLTSIMGLINLWKVEKDAAVQFEYLKMMEQSVLHLDGTIIEILDYSRNSRIALNVEPVSIDAMVNEIFANTQFVEGKNNINKLISINESIPLITDKYRLKIILNNLISNAIKYSKKNIELSFIEITATVTPDKAIITVSDNGIGIDEKSSDKIFDIFFRGTSEASGSGLGLYIVKETIAKMNGKIEVQSSLGEGTVFKVELPNNAKF